MKRHKNAKKTGGGHYIDRKKSPCLNRRAEPRRWRVLLFDLSWECGGRLSFFFFFFRVLCMSMNDHGNTESIDLGAADESE